MPENPMTGIALSDCESVLIAVEGQRIPRRAWSSVDEMSRILSEAGRVLENARRQAELLRRRAYNEGRAAGLAWAQAQAVSEVLEVQRQAREFMDYSGQRIIALAVSIVTHIAPRLGQGELVAALAAEALNAVHEERHLSIHVSTGAEPATRAMLEKWQLGHPEVETVQVLADPHLEPFACVVESELGRIEVGLSAQLETVREGLVAAVAEKRK